MRRRFAVSAAIAGVVVVVVALADMRGRNETAARPAGTQPVHCSIFADGPRRDGDPARQILARVRFRCDWPGADVLMLGVRLERQQGSGWQTIRAQSYTVRGTSTYARVFKYLDRQLNVRCASGRYRTSVEWTRTSRGETNSGRARSGEIVDPCASTFRAAT